MQNIVLGHEILILGIGVLNEEISNSISRNISLIDYAIKEEFKKDMFLNIEDIHKYLSKIGFINEVFDDHRIKINYSKMFGIIYDVRMILRELKLQKIIE